MKISKNQNKDIFREAIQKRLNANLQKNPNLLLELKKAKNDVIDAIEEYVAIIKREEGLDELTEDQLEEKLDAWGKCLTNILYYEEVELQAGRDISAIKKFMNQIMGISK